MKPQNEREEAMRLKTILTQTAHRRHSAIVKDDTEAADAAESPWDICNVVQLQHWVKTKPTELFDMLELVREERDTCLEVTTMAKAWAEDRNAAKVRSDSLQEDVETLQATEDDLTAKLAQAKLTIKTLRRDRVAAVMADDNEEPSGRSHKHEKTAKHPDPPMFTDGVDPTWDDWSSKMEHKLIVNHDWFPSTESKLAYVISRLGGKAAIQTMNRRRRGCDNPYQSYKGIMDELEEVYEDTDRKGSAIIEFDKLQQGKDQPFMEFYADFIRLGQIMKTDTDTLLKDLRKKMRSGMKLHWDSQGGFKDLKSAKEFLRKLDNTQRGEYEEKFRNTPKASSATRTATTTRSKAVTTPKLESTVANPVIKTEVVSKEYNCFLCGKDGHRKPDCPDNPKNQKKPSTSTKVNNIDIDNLYSDEDDEDSSSDSGNE